MELHSIRILDFDDSVARQEKLLAQYRPQVVDLRDIGSDARLWVSRKIKEEISRRIPVPVKGQITFLGSGDFHHVSNILIEKFDEPLCVIDFDFHPDWDILAPFLTCGSWAHRTLNNANVKKFIVAGVGSDDLSPFWLPTGDLAALKDDRLEIYPYSHGPTRLFLKRIPDNISIEVRRSFLSSTIQWNELKGKNLTEFFLHVIRRLPVKNVYISVDKDCLTREYALTNWEEGRLSLDDLLHMLKLIKENLDIVGADITGDYSRPSVKGVARSFISKINHPAGVKAEELDDSAVTALNEETNLKLLKLLM
ncbi:MAG: hypothetical protein JW919_03340 [Candidatus Omnitrophica bacterium]|nr:hypothetical protein [Candidatus Omnitrophota bacterium]